MDMAQGGKHPLDSADNAVTDGPVDIGSDERRMHVRAYNHWVSLLGGRDYPALADLDPAGTGDFGAHSVLLDFSGDVHNPAIRYLGTALREECGVPGSIARVAEVPGRSLLSRLTDHYLQIIANRAPIGFEAEFIGQRGHDTLYRGILMPFSSNGESIDFIYGVINWKEMADAATGAQIAAQIADSRRTAQVPPGTAVWADGPSSGFDAIEVALPKGASLADRLAQAREAAAVASAADTRGRAALHRALAHAYDFALAAEAEGDAFSSLLAEAELALDAHVSLGPAVQLIFGTEEDKGRLAAFAAVLAHAQRIGVPAKGFETFLDAEGGVDRVVRADRAYRNRARSALFARAEAELRARAPLAQVAIDAPGDEFVLLVARNGGDGLDIVARVADDAGLTARAIRRAAA